MADNLAQGLNLDQSLPIIKSMASEEARQKSESNKAAEAQILSQEGLYSKPAPDFKPSDESASGFAALGALLAASGAILGSGGRSSGLMAMNAVSGMMNGYNAGRKDLYEQERQKFEESMKSWEKNRALIKDAFDRAMKIAPTNLKLAQESLNRDLISLGQKPLAEMVQRSGPMPAAAAFYKANDNTTTKLNELSSVLGTAASRLPPDQKQYYDTLKTNQARVQFLESVAAQQAAAKKFELEQRKEDREEKVAASLIAQRKATIAKKEAETSSGLSDEAKRLAAERLLAGDKSAVSNIPRSDKTAIENMLVQVAKEQGFTASDIAAAQIALSGAGAFVRTAETQKARTGAAEDTALGAIDIIKKESAKVPRGTFKTMNAIVQRGLEEISDKNLLGFKKALDTLIIEYARATTTVGQSTDTRLKLAQGKLSTVNSEEGLYEQLDVMQQEMENARKAQDSIIRERLKQIGKSTDSSVPPDVTTSGWQ